MKIKLLSVFLVFTLLMGGLTANAQNGIPNTVEEGDEFTFSVTALNSEETVNGTSYNSQVLDSPQKHVVVVDEVNVYNESDGLIGSSTYVNVTETVDGGEGQATSSAINGYEGYLLAGILIAAFSAFGYPDYLSFDEPEETEGYDTTDLGDGTLPYFATSNETYYRDQVDAFEEEAKDEAPSEDVDFSTTLEDGIFQQSMSFTEENSTTTQEGQDASYTLKFDYSVTVDIERSLVTDFVLDISMDYSVADATSGFSLKVAFNEGSGFLQNLGVPFNPVFITMLFGFVALPVLNKFRN